jgi:predicted Fe-Mo cluster-binding NifX family protein
MKIAVSASGTGPAAQVDPRFGRCVHFVFYDTVAGAYEAVANTGAAASGGSGIQAAQGVVNAGVGTVLTGHIGPNAFRVLDAAGIKCYTGAGGTVEEFIAAYQAGELNLVSGATVMPHAGSGRGIGRSGGRGAGKGGRTF